MERAPWRNLNDWRIAMVIGQAESVKPWPWHETLIGGGSLQACLHTNRLNFGFVFGLANSCSGLTQGKPIQACAKILEPLKDAKIARFHTDSDYLIRLSTMNFTSFQPFPVHEGPHLGQAIVPMRMLLSLKSFKWRFHQMFIQSDAKIYM